jgi:hypothetical protein
VGLGQQMLSCLGFSTYFHPHVLSPCHVTHFWVHIFPCLSFFFFCVFSIDLEPILLISECKPRQIISISHWSLMQYDIFMYLCITFIIYTLLSTFFSDPHACPLSFFQYPFNNHPILTKY